LANLFLQLDQIGHFTMNGGEAADSRELVKKLFPQAVWRKFDIFSYRGDAAILAQNFRSEFHKIVQVLEAFEITTTMIRQPGGSKSSIAKYLDHLFIESEWRETRIVGDLHVRLLSPHSNELLREYTRTGYLDGHRIDFVSGKVALDLEWNSKDQTFDRDLYALLAFHMAGAIEVGVPLTRGNDLDTGFMRALGKVLTKSGEEGTEDVYRKFGASTTSMGKLLYRLDADRNGGCPILALGIKPACVIDYTVDFRKT